MLVQRIAASVALTGLILLGGCEPSSPSPSAVPDPSQLQQRPLKLVIVDDPELAKVALREWTARAERALETVTITNDELRAAISSGNPALMRADAIIFPQTMLGELAAHDWLQPIPDFVIDNPAFADGDLGWNEDLLPLPRSTGMWGDLPHAIPLGARVFTLGYRADVLEQLGLPAPSTWTELKVAVETFRKAQAAQHWPDYAVAQPLADDWAARTMLAYAAALCHDRGRYSTLFNLRTMQPSIESPGFQRALQCLIENHKDSPRDMSPVDAYHALLDGKCLFAIGWPDTSASPDSELLDVIRVIEMPAAAESYTGDNQWQPHESPVRVPLAFPSGRLGAALRHSRSQRPAWNLIVRLGGKEWGLSVCSASAATGPVRFSQLAPWLRRLPPTMGYGNAVAATLQQRESLKLLGIPAADRYLSALDQAVREAVAGRVDAREALQRTSAAWVEITTELGTDAQVKAYYRHLGLEP